jgi:cysteine desulfurase
LGVTLTPGVKIFRAPRADARMIGKGGGVRRFRAKMRALSDLRPYIGRMTAPARIYLDHNATSPLRPEARAAMLGAFDLAGNASSIHAEGRAARAALEAARAKIARCLEAQPKNLVFVSGATEAANLVLTPHIKSCAGAVCENGGYARLLIGATEHPAVLAGHRFGAAVEILPVDRDGVIRLDALAEALARPGAGRALVALQAANNETGVLQPVAEAAKIAEEAGALLICDATQAVGRIKTGLMATGAGILFCSAHKLGGPKGIGALVFVSDAIHLEKPLISGGGQERGRRAGTENLAAAAGFAAALEAATAGLETEAERLCALRDELEAIVRRILPDARPLGAGAPRLPNVAAFTTPGFKAETLLMALDLAGVAVSSGSACSSGKVKTSHVLAAMGETENAALRASLGWNSTLEEIQSFGIAFAEIVGRMKARTSAA